MHGVPWGAKVACESLRQELCDVPWNRQLGRGDVSALFPDPASQRDQEAAVLRIVPSGTRYLCVLHLLWLPSTRSGTRGSTACGTKNDGQARAVRDMPSHGTPCDSQRSGRGPDVSVATCDGVPGRRSGPRAGLPPVEPVALRKAIARERANSAPRSKKSRCHVVTFTIARHDGLASDFQNGAQQGLNRVIAIGPASKRLMGQALDCQRKTDCFPHREARCLAIFSRIDDLILSHHPTAPNRRTSQRRAGPR